MDQERIGKLIKDLRKQSNMTQNEFAQKYGVSFQAVSKWENGKNLPDILLLKQICHDYNINIDDILDGNLSNQKKTSKIFYILPIIVIILLITYLFIHNNNTKNFEFRTLSSSCNIFKINGSIAYNDNKASIYISNIEYCGKEENNIYKSIECNLYENNGNNNTIIGTCNYAQNQNIKLEDYLKNVTISIDNYQKNCKEYTDNSLYLQISALNSNDKIINFKIPISIEKCA